MDERELTRRVFESVGDDPRAEARARALLGSHIEAAAAVSARPVRSNVGALAAAAVAVALIVGIASLDTARAPSAAARELGRLADVARAARAPQLPSDAFLYMQAEQLRPETISVIGGPSFTVSARLTVETWIAPDGSGSRRTTVENAVLASEDDERRWERAGSPPLPTGETRVEQYSALDAPWFDTSVLSTDPAIALEQLRAGEPVEHPPGDIEVFAVIGDLLAQSDASPGVRAAMFEAAGALEGVEFEGDVLDQLGRNGVGFSMEDARHRVTLIFDPNTAQLLSTEARPIGDERLLAWRAFRPAVVTTEAPSVG
jgi:hypothetical protein